MDTTKRREWNAQCDDLRMDAYYYGFDGTGERAIDLVLSAVAKAGKAYHHTESWSDDGDGPSYAERIQHAADSAAEDIRSLRAAVARVREPHWKTPRGLCNGCRHVYPCPTVRALDGET